MECSSFLAEHLVFLYFIAQIQDEDMNAFNKWSYNCLTSLLAGSPVEQRRRRVNLAFVDGSVLPSLNFQFFPVGPLKKRLL